LKCQITDVDAETILTEAAREDKSESSCCDPLLQYAQMIKLNFRNFNRRPVYICI